MKITHSSIIQRLILAAALSTGLGFVSPVFAQERSYIVDLNSKKVTDLGTLGGGYSYASGINDAGQVVGSSDTAAGASHAFITGPNGVGMTDLGTLGGGYSYASGINDAGQVAISSLSTTGSRAFITGPNGQGMTDLGTLGGSESNTAGINNTGQVVGESQTTSGIYNGFITGPNGQGMTAIESWPRYINAAGQVVGQTGSPEEGFRVFVTGANGMGVTILGTLGGDYGAPGGINDFGQVAGTFGTTTTGVYHAFITGPNGQGMTDLGTLAEGTNSWASGINNAGQVVGYTETSNGRHDGHAFITGPNGTGMTDLNSLINPPNGIVFTEAAAINNNGQVLVSGQVPGIPEPVPGIPEPESYALLLAGLGLIGFMARHRKLT